MQEKDKRTVDYKFFDTNPTSKYFGTEEEFKEKEKKCIDSQGTFFFLDEKGIIDLASIIYYTYSDGWGVQKESKSTKTKRKSKDGQKRSIIEGFLTAKHYIPDITLMEFVKAVNPYACDYTDYCPNVKRYVCWVYDSLEEIRNSLNRRKLNFKIKR